MKLLLALLIWVDIPSHVRVVPPVSLIYTMALLLLYVHLPNVPLSGIVQGGALVEVLESTMILWCFLQKIIGCRLIVSAGWRDQVVLLVLLVFDFGRIVLTIISV